MALLKNKTRPNFPKRYILVTAALFITLTFLLAIVFKVYEYGITLPSQPISFRLHSSLKHTVSDEFLSFGLDTSLLRDMKNLPIHEPIFITLTQYLSPAYVRFGGTDADCLIFEDNKNEENAKTVTKVMVEHKDLSNFTITAKDFSELYNYTRKTKIKMLFDLNVLIRNPNNTWNENNAKKIITFAKSHQMDIDWQMGNEPNSFLHVFNRSVTAESLAQDYCKLRSLLDNLGYKESIIVGPEANHIGDEQHNGEKYARIFLDNVDNCIDSFTWHQYYLNGHIATVTDFVTLSVFNRLPEQIETIDKIRKASGKNIPAWISETGSAYGGGAPGLSNKFAATFLWLDKLGISAKKGVQTVIRQTLFGGDYAMVDHDLRPNPDWWIAVLFKKLVSKQVLYLESPNPYGKIRLYAHCTPLDASKNSSGITIYGINLNNEASRINIDGIPQDSVIYSYVLTSSELTSRDIMLNGKLLKLEDNSKLPDFKPHTLRPNETITLPPFSLIFLVCTQVNIPLCS